MKFENKERLKKLLMEVLHLNENKHALEIQIKNGCVYVDEYCKTEHINHIYYSRLFQGWDDEDDDED